MKNGLRRKFSGKRTGLLIPVARVVFWGIRADRKWIGLGKAGEAGKKFRELKKSGGITGDWGGMEESVEKTGTV